MNFYLAALSLLLGGFAVGLPSEWEDGGKTAWFRCAIQLLALACMFGFGRSACAQVTVSISPMDREAVQATYGRSAARRVGAITAGVHNIGKEPALITYDLLGAIAAADSGLSVYSLGRTGLMLGEAHRRSWPEIAARAALLDLPMIPAVLGAAGAIAIPQAALVGLLASVAFSGHLGERLKQIEPATAANFEVLRWQSRILGPGEAALAEIYVSPKSKPTARTITIPPEHLPPKAVTATISEVMRCGGLSASDAACNLLALSGGFNGH